MQRDNNIPRLDKTAGLCVREGNILFSGRQKLEENSFKYIVRIINDNNKVSDVSGPFEYIRGIYWSNTSKSFFVLDSTNHQLLKYGSDWTPLRQTYQDDYLHNPFGMFINENESKVFVCDTSNDRICVLDKDLNHICYILGITSPKDITYFQGKYFVTSRGNGQIVVLDIDFAKRSFRRCNIQKMTINNNDVNPSFNPSFSHKIRGICAKGNYLYVTERAGRILCLEYQPKSCLQCDQLRYVTELDGQGPITIISDNDNIYYTRKDRDKNYIVAKLFYNANGELESEDIYPVT